MLCISSLLNETDFRVFLHVRLIEATLALYENKKRNLLFVVAFSTNMCPEIAQQPDVKFIGTDAYKFNLAADHILEQKQQLLNQIKAIMQELNTTTQL